MPDWPAAGKYLCMSRHTNRVTDLKEGELAKAMKESDENDLPIGDIDEDDHEVCLSTVTRGVLYLQRVLFGGDSEWMTLIVAYQGENGDGDRDSDEIDALSDRVNKDKARRKLKKMRRESTSSDGQSQ